MVVVETIVFAYVPNTQTPPAIYNIHGAPAINNTHLFYGGVPNFLATIPLNTTIYYNTVTGYEGWSQIRIRSKFVRFEICDSIDSKGQEIFEKFDEN